MAGYVVTTSNEEIIFYVGQEKIIKSISPHTIKEVQLDGHELDHVLITMPNLPRSSGRVVSYFGDHAKFIIANWG